MGFSVPLKSHRRGTTRVVFVVKHVILITIMTAALARPPSALIEYPGSVGFLNIPEKKIGKKIIIKYDINNNKKTHVHTKPNEPVTRRRPGREKIHPSSRVQIGVSASIEVLLLLDNHIACRSFFPLHNTLINYSERLLFYIYIYLFFFGLFDFSSSRNTQAIMI